MKDFLAYVAEDIISKYGTDLSHITVVFPNKRASLFLNEHLARLAEKPIWSPSYITISDLFRQQSDLMVADPIKLVCDLHKSFCLCTGIDESLDKFYGWGQLLLTDFDDIDKNMADADRVFANLRDIHELDDVSYLTDEQREMIRRFFSNFSEEHNSELKERFLRLWSHFADIYHNFNRRLAAQGLAYEGALYRQVVHSACCCATTTNTTDATNATSTPSFPAAHYLFVGFNLLQKVEQKLFTTLKAEGKASFYWDFDHYYMQDNEAGQYIGQYLELFPNALDIQADDIYRNFQRPKHISYIAAPTENIQARYVSTWLREQQRYADRRRTAIVLCNEALLPVVIHCLPPEVDKVNITTGYPLSQTPVASFIQLYFNMMNGGRSPRLVRIFQRHPYAQYIEEGGEEAKAINLTQLLTFLRQIARNANSKDPLFQESVFRAYTLVNRILRQGLGNGHSLEGTFGGGATIKIPHSNENLRLGAYITYNDRNEHLFNRQSVQYAAVSQQPPTYNHQYTDNHPDRSVNSSLTVGYNIPLGKGWRSLFTTYEFAHDWRHRRSSLYLLDVPQAPPSAPEGATIDPTFNSKTIEAPSGAVGGALGATLPSVSEYQQVMDSRNSFDSRSTEDRHKLDINLGYKFDKKSYGKIWTLLNGNVSLRSQHLDYQRGRIDTTLCRTAFTISMADWTYLDLKGGHQIGLTLGVQTDLPDLEQRIDLRDDTDPMNIRLGNPNLRTAVTPEFKINGVYRKKLSYHYLEWGYQRTYNAIAMGYVYDPQTGVRTYRPENVDGNWTTDGGYTFHCSLDSTKKLNLDIPFHITYAQSVDLIGIVGGDLKSPTPEVTAPSLTGRAGGESIVRRLALSLTPTFKADIGQHHFELTCQPAWDRYTSDRPDFDNFNAFACRTSLSAIIKLPWKLDLSTDLSLYTRTGYADEALNTNDLVWNARLTRPFLKGRLLMIFDGFDILGQLSNVTRTLNAQGRTETYTNVMPRYALLHIVYRLNKQPKNKVRK